MARPIPDYTAEATMLVASVSAHLAANRGDKAIVDVRILLAIAFGEGFLAGFGSSDRIDRKFDARTTSYFDDLMKRAGGR